MIRLSKCIFTPFLLLLMTACASNTQLLSVEKEEGTAAPYKKVLVLAVSENGQIRQVVEQGIADELSKAGIESLVASLKMPGGLDKENPDDIRAPAEKVVKESGVDSVLVAVLVQEEMRQEYEPPTREYVAVANVPYFMGYGAYVGYHYQTVYTPGYITEEQNYFVQSSLFDATNGKRVWSAQSKTMNPAGVQEGVEGFSALVVGRLLSDSMLTKRK